jgi:hypothetical protein
MRRLVLPKRLKLRKSSSLSFETTREFDRRRRQMDCSPHPLPMREGGARRRLERRMHLLTLPHL